MSRDDVKIYQAGRIETNSGRKRSKFVSHSSSIYSASSPLKPINCTSININFIDKLPAGHLLVLGQIIVAKPLNILLDAGVNQMLFTNWQV
jgi:hypothetical protein